MVRKYRIKNINDWAFIIYFLSFKVSSIFRCYIFCHISIQIDNGFFHIVCNIIQRIVCMRYKFLFSSLRYKEQELLIESVCIQKNDRLSMLSQLLQSDDHNYFLQSSPASRQSDKSICMATHQGLAFFHIWGNNLSSYPLGCNPPLL